MAIDKVRRQVERVRSMFIEAGISSTVLIAFAREVLEDAYADGWNDGWSSGVDQAKRRVKDALEAVDRGSD